jgi:PleD family two-component response regulator
MSFQSLISSSENRFETNVRKALLIDDCEFDRRRIKRLNSKLETPLILEEVPNIDSMNNCLDAVSFDLIMIDYGLGKEDGLSALDMIQRHKLNQDAAKIMITGNTQASVAVSALKRGCSDYVSKKELTPELFQKSVFDALKKARPAAVSADQSVQEVLRHALLDGDLQAVLRESVRTAMRENGVNRDVSMVSYDRPDALQSLLIGLMDEDDFIFR